LKGERRHGISSSSSCSYLLCKFITYLQNSQIDEEGIVVVIGDDYSVMLKLYVMWKLELNNINININIILFYFKRLTGTTISVPAHNILIPTPSVGEIVTFTFEGNNRGVLINPTIIRIRTDMDELIFGENERQGMNVAEFDFASYYLLLQSINFPQCQSVIGKSKICEWKWNVLQKAETWTLTFPKLGMIWRMIFALLW
jgi:hypothetical protein